MSDDAISTILFSDGDVDAVRPATSRASIRARITARLRAGRFDRMIAVGVPAEPGSALALHTARLVSDAERDAIVRALRQVVGDAAETHSLLAPRVTVHRYNVLEARDLIESVALRLDAPQPVRARGMARLRQLLADGSGPMYRSGHGDLRGRLGAALAAL